MERMRINREKNEVILNFNNKFYTQEHINQAIKDFSGICNSRKEGENLILSPKKRMALDKLGYEFYTYLLCLIKNL